jgi:DNA-binding response OmpR family regulator
MRVDELALSQAFLPSLAKAGIHTVERLAERNIGEPILVVESDADLGRQLVDQLHADGHPADLARTASHARHLAHARQPRLLLLGELDTPRGTLDLLESIRNCRTRDANSQQWSPTVPIIVLSSRTTQPDLLRAFDTGADDFLPRPVAYLELRARMQALLRRCQRTPEDRPLQIGPLTIDRASHAASLHGKPLDLRRKEYELLLHLAANPKRVFHRQELLSGVWGFRSPGSTRTLDSHASRLRRKLGITGEHWIINVWGVGYRLM